MTRARPPRKRSRRAAWRQPAGWSTVGVGTVLVGYGFFGGALGIRLPFDPHHVLSQITGLLLVIMGFVWATTPQR